jgi:hypothetical protein
MEQKYSIAKWCTIANEVICCDGVTVFEGEKGNFSAFVKTFYKSNQIDYPKFFKMDALSKLAFIGAECLLQNEDCTAPSQDIALLFSNASSSLDTDCKHSETIKNKDSFYPSPAVFVYTLANICMAEVSIKHKLQSEQVFFVSPTLDIDLMFAQATYLLQSQRAKKVLCAWVEYLDGEYKLFAYLVEPFTGETIEHTKQNIIDLYTK